jgi:uncharacterized protein
VIIDLPIAIGGLLVGTIVGLTGVGGGALMTPMLVLIFGIEPLAAVSSDVVASLIMKPIGGGVHLRRGTVNMQLVKWLMLGSLPCAFLGVLLLKSFGGTQIQSTIKLGLGVALVLASAGILLRPLIMRKHRDAPPGESTPIRRLPTVVIGILGGLIVGMTSVGSGSLMIVMLLMLYPRLKLSDLVGTDLVQAIPLVGSAALAHFLFGDFRLALTGSILLGAIPGVYIGARMSSRAPDRVLRPVLLVALTASATRLLGASNQIMLIAATFALGAVLLMDWKTRRRLPAVAVVSTPSS